MSRKSSLMLGLFLFAKIGFSATPVLSFQPLTELPTSLANNASSTLFYVLTNNSKQSTFSMSPISGVTQITNSTGACSNPITLAQNQSCLLYLIMDGSQIPSRINGGPLVSNTSFNVVQPSQANSLYTQSMAAAPVLNDWIKVLVAQEVPPVDVATYASQIKALAPSATQIHIRVAAGDTNYSFYASVIAALRAVFPSSLQVGFHPDNTQGSCTSWGCPNCATQPPYPDADWQCILNKSIIAMNNINALADPSHTGLGFNIFSIEQSYAEPEDSSTLQNIKACLCPVGASHPCPGGSQCPTCPTTNTGTCPVITLATPAVTFGTVGGSYGGSDIYGLDKLNYNYPQYYNLGKQIPPEYNSLISGGYFPSYSTSCFSAPYPQHLYVVDVDNGDNPYSPQIPCLAAYQQHANVFTFLDPTTNEPSPLLASTYLSFLMTQLPPISNIVDTSGSSVYLTFSGETDFLGGNGWSLAKVLQFNQDINTNFTQLKYLFPDLFTQGANPNTIEYGIWNFEPMLGFVA